MAAKEGAANPQYNFLQAANFGKGLTFSKGLHRVSAAVTSHPYFQKLAKAGLVVPANAPAGAAPTSQPLSRVEAQKKAIDSSKAQAAAKAKAAAPKDEGDQAAPAEKAAPKKGAAKSASK